MHCHRRVDIRESHLNQLAMRSERHRLLLGGMGEAIANSVGESLFDGISQSQSAESQLVKKRKDVNAPGLSGPRRRPIWLSGGRGAVMRPTFHFLVVSLPQPQ